MNEIIDESDDQAVSDLMYEAAEMGWLPRDIGASDVQRQREIEPSRVPK